MRKWNKLLALLLAMVMVFGLTATAFADEEKGDTQDGEKTEATESTDEKDEAKDPAEDDKTADDAADPAAPADDADKTDDAADPADDADKADDAADPADGADKTDDTAEPVDDADKTDDAAEPTEGEDKAEEPVAVTFSDVKEGQWHYEYIQKMVAAGVVAGYPDGSFKPNDTLTWGAAVKMAVVFATGEEKAPVEGGNWASGYVAYLKDEGIWTEDIDHNAKITRVEICQLIAKALKVAESDKESTFPDTTDGYVTALVELGVVGGNPDGTFNPDGELTRAAMCRILASVPDSVMNPAPAETEGEDPAEPADTEGEDAKDPAEDDKTDDAADDANKDAKGDKANDTKPAEDAEADDAKTEDEGANTPDSKAEDAKDEK